jgi:ribonuclease R
MAKKNKKKNKFIKGKSGETFNKKKLKNLILSVLYEEPSKTVNYKQVSTLLGIKDFETSKLVSVVLQELSDDEYLDQISRGKFRLKAKTGTVCGIVELRPQGYAYVNSDEVDRPVLVSSRNLKHAMDGDKVRLHVYASRKKHDLEGEVVDIIERAKSVFVGTVQLSRNFAFLVPSGKVGFDIFIAHEKLNGAKNGQKAIAQIVEWPAHARSPFGEIIEVLGDTGDNDAEMHAILAEFELPHKFPQNVEKIAEKIPLEIPEEEYKKRRDMRKELPRLQSTRLMPRISTMHFRCKNLTTETGKWAFTLPM